jgi:hypothetical protein
MYKHRRLLFGSRGWAQRTGWALVWLVLLALLAVAAVVATVEALELGVPGG